MNSSRRCRYRVQYQVLGMQIEMLRVLSLPCALVPSRVAARGLAVATLRVAMFWLLGIEMNMFHMSACNVQDWTGYNNNDRQKA